jgi:hypothetical protein
VERSISLSSSPRSNLAILNLDLANIRRLDLERFNHKGHPLGPTLKEEILGQGGEIMEERLSGGQRLANGPVGGVDQLKRVSQEGQEVERQERGREKLTAMAIVVL